MSIALIFLLLIIIICVPILIYLIVRLQKKSRTNDIVDTIDESKTIEQNDIKDVKDTEKRKIKWGWMALFIAILVVILPISHLFYLIYSWSDAINYDLFNLYPNFYFVALAEVTITLFLIFFSIYAGLSLYLFKDRAVSKAKMFLIVYLIIGIFLPSLYYFAGFPEDVGYYIGAEIFGEIFRSFIFFGVWYWFITSSKTVNRIYFQDVKPIKENM